MIALVGMSHHTASFELLERASAAAAAMAPSALGSTSEWLALVTCNRVELYFVHEPGLPVAAAAADELARRSGVRHEQLDGSIYVLKGTEAVRHLMRVAAGLDSMIVGEAEILGQLARALKVAQREQLAGLVLTRLVRAAVGAGRRARSETGIGRHTASVSHAAARIALAGTDDPSSTQALVVGAGEAATLAAQALRHCGAGRIMCTSRTWAHAEVLAGRVGGTALHWSHLREGIARADVVLAATSAPDPVVCASDVEPLLDSRGGRPLALVDLAIPRDIEAAVGRLQTVRLYDLDDLRAVVDEGLAQRRAEIPTVERIVDDEAERFRLWLEGRRVAPLITELRERVVHVARAEVRAAFDRSRQEDDLDEIAARVAERIATRVLHEPVLQLKARAARDGATSHIAAMRELFALDSREEAEAG